MWCCWMGLKRARAHINTHTQRGAWRGRTADGSNLKRLITLWPSSNNSTVSVQKQPFVVLLQQSFQDNWHTDTAGFTHWFLQQSAAHSILFGENVRGKKKHSMFLPGPQMLICIKVTQCFTNTERVPTLCKSKTNFSVDISAIEAQSLAATAWRSK